MGVAVTDTRLWEIDRESFRTALGCLTTVGIVLLRRIAAASPSPPVAV